LSFLTSRFVPDIHSATQRHLDTWNRCWKSRQAVWQCFWGRNDSVL